MFVADYSGISAKTFNQVAQLDHFAGGMAIVFGIVVLTWHREAALWAFLSVGILAAIKEFWYDEHYETAEVRGSSLEDFLFYMLGAVVALILTWIHT